MNKVCDQIWEKYDLDDNGKLDYEELKKMLKDTFDRITDDAEFEEQEDIEFPSEEEMQKAF